MARWMMSASTVLAILLGTGSRGWSQFREVGLEYQRSHPQFIAAFREVTAKSSKGTVTILCDDKETALGMVVGPDGWILTKANDLQGKVACRLRDGRTLDAQIVGMHTGHDLAVLRIPTKGLASVEFKDSRTASVGHWVVCCGPRDEPVAIGIVSVAARTTASKMSPADSGYLGVAVEQIDGTLCITLVVPESAAAKAGLKTQDILLSMQGKTIDTPDTFIDVMQKQKVGEVVTLRIKRGSEDMQIQTTLGKRPVNKRGDFQNRMGTDLSSRISGYATILQHDASIKPRDCGGPLVDLEGKVIGINICRAGRTETWAIPSEVFLPVLPDLMSGKLPPPEKPQAPGQDKKNAK